MTTGIEGHFKITAVRIENNKLVISGENGGQTQKYYADINKLLSDTKPREAVCFDELDKEIAEKQEYAVNF